MTEVEKIAAGREVDCPRCHEACGWCADYRWMHGLLPMPNDTKRRKRRCSVKGFEPEGDNCPLCHGSRRVIATTTYRPTHLQETHNVR